MTSVARNNSSIVTAVEAEQLLAGTLTLSNDEVVPFSKSKIRDSEWHFFDLNNHEHVGLGESTLAVHWLPRQDALKNGALEFSKAPLPSELLFDLQTFGYILLKYYPLFALHKKGNKFQIKPLSFVTTTLHSVHFLQWIVQTARLRYTFINSLEDLTISDIERAAADYPYALNNMAMTFLWRLASPFVRPYLKKPPRFSQTDVSNINWTKLFKANKSLRAELRRTKREYQDIQGNNGFLPLSPDMFVWLSNTTRADVADCLDAMGIEREDHSPNPELQKRAHQHGLILDRYPLFKECWQTLQQFGTLAKGNKHSSDIEKIDRRVKGGFGSTTAVLGVIERARDAAQILTLQYSGMRSGSTRTLLLQNNKGNYVSCLKVENGFSLLKGINTKTRSSQTPMDADKWIAIDCVRDAVRLIEAIFPVHGNPYLFSAWARHRSNQPRTSGSLSEMIRSYIALADVDEKFVTSTKTETGAWKPVNAYTWREGVPPSPIRFRHSLVAELARVDCGLPLITLQLKHFHSLYTGYSATTVRYGGIREQALYKVEGMLPAVPSDLTALMDEKAKYSRTAREDIFLAYFDPARRFAGGGSGAHVSRITEFFVGTGFSEKERERYIRNLANNGAPLVACGLGYCNKRYAEGDEVCKGDLCDPDCHNHVVTEVKIPLVKLRLRNCREMLERPEQSHQRPKWERDKDVLERILVKLGEDPEEDGN